jgi:hypothetical protein
MGIVEKIVDSIFDSFDGCGLQMRRNRKLSSQIPTNRETIFSQCDASISSNGNISKNCETPCVERKTIST